MPNWVDKDLIRAKFALAMSVMYQQEVPAYQQLVEIVKRSNVDYLNANSAQAEQLRSSTGFSRIDDERHGAIRLGSADELKTMARLFAVMGMHPVGYYDLSSAGIPVHSTAFRALGAAALDTSPFRVFCSLLRLALIDDPSLREQASQLLAGRQIFSPDLLALMELAADQDGLTPEQADRFIEQAVKVFAWHAQATVDLETYNKLHNSHRLIADVVSFKGPHINHLTPRSLDIDAAAAAMHQAGMAVKAVIEGPPRRDCPILLRQTSFKALEETVDFVDQNGRSVAHQHSARFGEIEQRGIALTPKGRALYDRLLNQARQQITPTADGSNAARYVQCLGEAFAAFPDDWAQIHAEALGYFNYHANAKTATATAAQIMQAPTVLVSEAWVDIEAIIYEDFLPVSAAGIFQSNLGDVENQSSSQNSEQSHFESALGRPVIDEFESYAQMQAQSLAACRALVLSK